jgi:hydroxymethylpyrimidine/phosphomethylpyrimidine kinase
MLRMQGADPGYNLAMMIVSFVSMSMHFFVFRFKYVVAGQREHGTGCVFTSGIRRAW